MDTKAKKRKQLRNNEYYDMQEVFDQLYANAGNNAKFTHLMQIVMSAENIKLAYRNIKKNKGSNTRGTDGKTIGDYESMNEEEMIAYFQFKMMNYNPKSVRRVEIPKPNGKMRPLGIPCMEDRIIQQCLKQVLEPICEAKFYKHSYGFRPNRSTRHAVARYSYLVNIMRLYYVVDVDIKGFFGFWVTAKYLKIISITYDVHFFQCCLSDSCILVVCAFIFVLRWKILPLSCNPPVQFIQYNICKQRTDNSALWDTFFRNSDKDNLLKEKLKRISRN